MSRKKINEISGYHSSTAYYTVIGHRAYTEYTNGSALTLLSYSNTAYKCITDQRERLEEALPLVLGLILGLIIVITVTVYHFHLKLTAHQPQLPRDRSLYKNM